MVFENIENLVPYNLCIIQKNLCTSYILYLLNKDGYLLTCGHCSMWQLFLSICLGIGASGRQIYLINLPRDQLPAGLCDLPFEAVFNIYPFLRASKKYFFEAQQMCSRRLVVSWVKYCRMVVYLFASMMLIGLRNTLLLYYRDINIIDVKKY